MVACYELAEANEDLVVVDERVQSAAMLAASVYYKQTGEAASAAFTSKTSNAFGRVLGVTKNAADAASPVCL